MITELEKYNNYNHFKSLLEEFDELGLEIGEYTIFGSGPLAIRGLVHANDIDVIVRENCWRFGKINTPTIKIGNIELSIDWNPDLDVDMLINTSDIIEGHSYVKIKHVLEYKLLKNREKDQQILKFFKLVH